MGIMGVMDSDTCASAVADTEGRIVTMQKGLYKRSGLEGLFTDFKHNARSWKNSKRMRAKRERQWLKKLRKEGDHHR